MFKSIDDLIAAIRESSADITVNVTIKAADTPTVEAAKPDTDFQVGDRVLVCHIREDGSRVHTVGTVSEALGQDDIGWYTRVDGDNGKHYRAGLKYNEERLGTIIYTLD